MTITFKLRMEFTDGDVDIAYVQQSVIEALERARAEGCVTPDNDEHPAFVGAEIEELEQ